MYNPGQELSSLDFGAIIGGSLNAVIIAQSQSANTTVDFIKAVGFNKKVIQNEDGTTSEADIPINVAFTYDKEVSPLQYIGRTAWSVKVVKGGTGYSAGKEKYTLSVNGNPLTVNNVILANGVIEKIEIENLPDSITVEEGAKITLDYTGTKGTNFKEAELILTSKTSYDAVPAVIQKMKIEVPILTMMPIPFIKIAYADIDFNVKINSVSNTNSSSTTNAKVDTGYRGGFFSRVNLNASVSNQKTTNSSEEVKKDYSLNISVHAVQDDMPAGVSRILDMLEESIITSPVKPPTEESSSQEKK